MPLKELFNSYCNLGVKPEHRSWETSMIRKLNLLALFGTINVSLCLLIFLFFGYDSFYWDCIIVLVFAPTVPLLNIKGKLVLAAYVFAFIGIGMFASLNLKMGPDSFAFLLYFPLGMSVIQLFSRQELLKHMVIALLCGMISVVLVLVGYRYHWLSLSFEKDVFENIRTINLFFSLFTTLLFVVIISYESIRQQMIINSALQEKEILLAEVFHRVKNNMNIVTSLLNLKKNASTSPEVQDALEECRNRIFSMALVHQKIYNTKSFTRIDLKDYVTDLISALRESMGENQSVIDLECEKIDLELSNAIPCGLILNELITNSFKHAAKPQHQLRIRILIKRLGKEMLISYSDSGPGLPAEEARSKNTLGLDIIRSLSSQLDGQFEFGNEKGFTFDLRFPVK